MTDVRLSRNPRAARPGLRSRRGLAGVLAAQICTLSAARLLTVAVPWLLVTGTGDPDRAAWSIGIVVACQTAPYALMQWAAGPLIDRLGGRRISIIGDLTGAILLTVLALAPAAPVWLIAAVMFLVGTADGPAHSGRRLLVPVAAIAAGHSIERGVQYAAVAGRASIAIGAATAGWLLAATGGLTTLWTAAALLAAATAVTALVCPDAPCDRSHHTYLVQLRAGAAFLRRERSLRALSAMLLVTNLLDQALLALLLPLWVHTSRHDPSLIGLAPGVAGAAAAGSALAGTWLGARIRLPRRSVYLAGVLISGPTRIAVLSLDWPPAAVVAVFAIAGIGSGLFNPIVETVQIEKIPEALRGRVLAIISTAAWIGIPAGGLVGAALVETVGLTATTAVCAATYLAAVLYPAWRVTWQPSPGGPNGATASAQQPAGAARRSTGLAPT
ncbi:MFS transporter [Actinoplanes sp. NPDC020271]|uniref:MFS transporter n=1 Tax=Actinoplanes sp. NPDC020271 TaxID=3363896 RepID=UPI0037B97082